MDANDSQNEKQPAKRNAFAVMKNVRDMCKQPVGKKLLMFTLATYCDLDGICWPSNRTLAAGTGMSESTIKRMLRALHEEGELQILTPGVDRDTKRFIHLKRYVKQVTVMTPLNGSRLPMKRNRLRQKVVNGMVKNVVRMPRVEAVEAFKRRWQRC
jgi:hypothetical protein